MSGEVYMLWPRNKLYPAHCAHHVLSTWKRCQRLVETLINEISTFIHPLKKTDRSLRRHYAFNHLEAQWNSNGKTVWWLFSLSSKCVMLYMLFNHLKAQQMGIPCQIFCIRTKTSRVITVLHLIAEPNDRDCNWDHTKSTGCKWSMLFMNLHRL